MQTISVNSSFTLLQNIVYALPIRSVQVYVLNPISVIQMSMDGSTNWITQTINEGYFLSSGPFIRTTDASAVINAKAF
jgi:DNA polymerase III psi subunit